MKDHAECLRPIDTSPGQVRQELSTLEDSVEELSTAIAALERRICDIVRCEPDLGDTKSDEPVPVRVAVAEHIHTITMSLDRSVSRITSLIARIEL